MPNPREPLKPPRVLAGHAAVAAGVAFALVLVGASPSEAGPGPSLASVAAAASSTPPVAGASSDGGAPSSLVANAQKSQVVPPDLGAVERMCALLTSCEGVPIPASLVPDDFTSCVKRMSENMTSATAVNLSLTIRECGLQSDSCATLRACALHGSSAGACNGRGKQSVVSLCDGDGRALTCWHDQTLAVRDCPRGGEQCLLVGGQATCSLGPCPATIVEGDKPRCSGAGTHLLHCEKGKLSSLDCAAFGLRCSVGADGTAGCATAGPPCTAGSTRCDGNAAIGCVNGHEVRVECGAAGLACTHVAGAGVPVGACVASTLPSGFCDPSDTPRCDDGVIKYCAEGRPRTFGCKGAGFSRCDTSRNGIRCAP